MHPEEDSRDCGILYIDDEEKTLKYFEIAFRGDFRVLTASSGAAGYELLARHKDEIGVLLVDQRMPGETGLEFLERARRLHPAAIRILTTAYSDTRLVMSALKSSCVSKIVMKPWDVPDLEVVLKSACADYRSTPLRPL